MVTSSSVYLFCNTENLFFSVEENVLIIPLVQLTRKFRIEFVIFEYNNDKRENEQKIYAKVQNKKKCNFHRSN